MRLISFSGITLPDSNAQDDISIEWRSNLVPMRNGSIDLDGTKSFLQSNTVGREAFFVEAIDENVFQLLARLGAGLGVLRAKTRNEKTLMTLAKPSSYSRMADANNYYCYQPYTVRFEQAYPYWLDEQDGHFLDDGRYLDSGFVLDWQSTVATILGSGATSTSFTILNESNVPIEMMLISLTCDTSSDITGPIRLENLTNGLSFDYAGSLTSSEALRIDVLARRIEKDFVNVYSNFSIPSNTQIQWMRLEPGSNAMKLSYVNKSGIVLLRFQFLRHYL